MRFALFGPTREAFGSFMAISRKVFTCEADCYVSLSMTTLVMQDSKYAPFLKWAQLPNNQCTTTQCSVNLFHAIEHFYGIIQILVATQHKVHVKTEKITIITMHCDIIDGSYLLQNFIQRSAIVIYEAIAP